MVVFDSRTNLGQLIITHHEAEKQSVETNAFTKCEISWVSCFSKRFNNGGLINSSPSIFPFIQLFIHVCPFISSIYQPFQSSVYFMCIYFLICLLVHPSILPSIHLFNNHFIIHLSIYPFIIHPSISHSIIC